MSLIVLLVVVTTVTACTGTGAQPKGWSGVALSRGTLYLVSMEGKLVSVDVASHNRVRADIPLKTLPSAGGFGCAAPSTPVAVYGTAAVSGDVVYLGGYDGKIHAIAPGAEGSWIYPPESKLQPIVGGPVIFLGTLYFGDSGGKVYALDPVSRELRWQFATSDKIWSTPTIDGTTLYTGSFDKKLYAINLADGTKKWEFETGGAIAGSPFVRGNTVYIGSFDRHVYALNTTDGSLKWRSIVEADNWFWASLVVVNNTIYAGSLDGKVYALSDRDGSLLAKFDLKSPVASSPVTMDSAVIVASQEGKVYSIDSVTNEIKLLADVEEVYAPIYASDGVVYVHTAQNETLYALNAQTGLKLWSLLLGSK